MPRPCTAHRHPAEQASVDVVLFPPRVVTKGSVRPQRSISSAIADFQRSSNGRDLLVVGAVFDLELAALLGDGAALAEEVHVKVVAWLGLRHDAAGRKGRGKPHV